MFSIISEKAKTRGMTVAQVEKAADIGHQTIRRWDTHSPSIDKVFRVAKVLGCTVDELIVEPTGGEQYFRSVKDDGAAAPAV